LVEGEAMFWRPGAGDWEAAQQNLPLAAGDSLATRSGKLELQIGSQSFVRAGDDTQLRVQSNEPDFLELDVTAGHVSIDLRNLRRGTAVRIDSPNAAVSIGRDGYYRVDVDAQTTRVVVRRGGQASVTPAGGSVAEVATGEAIEVSGTETVQLAALAAPPFDDWDRWNYDRVDRLLAAPRSYAVSPDVYGAGELEQYGTWRYANTYGRVWVPNSVPTDWSPYTDGRWLWDPLYGYSWVDSAPWGWAPYHYGRWVYAGYWGWAPGPVLGVPAYSPALVAFFGAPGFSVGFGIGVPFVSWVPLGWGEPLIPWWGPVGFIGAPCWRGWGGPRIVNNVVINNNTFVNANTVNFYRNMHAPGGLVGVPRNQFDSHSLASARLTNFNRDQLQPVHGALPVASKSGGSGIPDVGGRRAFDGVPRGAAGPNFNRSGQGASSPGTNFGRAGQQAFGARGSGAQASSANTTHMLDELRARGPGALSPSARQNSATAAAPSARSTDFGRGESPPPLSRGGSNGTVSSAFDNLRRGNSPAAANNFGRPQAATNTDRTTAPQLPRGSTGSGNDFGRPSAPSAATTDGRRSAAPAAPSNFGRPGSSTAPSRVQSAPANAAPPAPSNFGRPGSSTAPSRVQSAPAPRQFERRADVPQARPPAPAWSTGRVATARAPERAVARAGTPNMPAYRAPSMGAGAPSSMRGFGSAGRSSGGAPSGGMPRGGGGATPSMGRAFGGLSAAGHGGGRGR